MRNRDEDDPRIEAARVFLRGVRLLKWLIVILVIGAIAWFLFNTYMNARILHQMQSL